MKSEKAREVLAQSYDGGHICMENAEQAVEIAEQEAEERMQQKAISAFQEVTDGYFIIGAVNYSKAIMEKFIQKLNE